MRSDMDKVIVERPRYGSWMRGPSKGYRKDFQRCSWEDQPKREKIRLNRSKSLNEHLGPLRRFLRSQVGRPWAKVHTEICANISRDSAVQDHVRDHVDDYVAVEVIMVNGVACHAAGHHIGRPLFSMFFVCPRSGLLRDNPNYRHGRRRRADRPLRLFPFDDAQYVVRHYGVWHVIRVANIPAQEWCPKRHIMVATWEIRRRDALVGKLLTGHDARSIYGRPIHAVEARLARKKEVRAAVNSYPLTNIVRR